MIRPAPLLVACFTAALALAWASCAHAAPAATPFSARVELLLARHLAQHAAVPGAATLQVGVHSLRTLAGAPTDLVVQGEAQLTGTGVRVPLRFELVLDRASGALLWLDYRWDEDGRAVAAPLANAPHAQALAALVSRGVAEEFDGQHSVFELGAMEWLEPRAGSGHLLAVGQGSTVFAGEASVPTRFSALVDRRTGELLAVRYALGGERPAAALHTDVAALLAD